jgi:hypothetical protein
VLINFSLRPGLRLRLPFVRGLLRFLLDPFDGILAVSQEAVQSGLACGLDPAKLRVTGDTRYDQVARRTRDAESATAAAPLRPLKGGRTGLVFGSTWPSDEAVIFPLLEKLRAASVDVWSVLVPHEPTGKHLSQIESQCGQSGLACRRLSAVDLSGPGGPFDVLLVDRVGIASLCAVGDAAFVGADSVGRAQRPRTRGIRHARLFRAQVRQFLRSRAAAVEGRRLHGFGRGRIYRRPPAADPGPGQAETDRRKIARSGP